MIPIALQEPLRWINLVTFLHDYMNYHNFLLNMIPITADIFVFFFPVLLVVLYVIWIVKDKKIFKESALWVFWSAILTTVVNVCIQFFFLKARPTSMLLWLSEEETLLHKFLPNSSFPSDHSAMSMWFAMWLLIRWIKNKDKKYVCLWLIFLVFALITGFSRIMVWVHRPTDIIGWFAIGIMVPLALSYDPIFEKVEKIFINPLIKFQERIWSIFSNKKNR